MALAERAELTARLSLKDEFSGKLKGAAGAMKDFDKSASNTSTSLGRTGQNIERLAAVGIGAFVGAVGLSIKAAGNFEESLHTINTVAGATPEALGKIGDSIRQLSRDTGTPLEDLTSAYYDLVSAGVKTADAQKVLTAANTLAIGGLATTAQTVDLLTTAINAYGGDASKAAEYADAFAEAIAAGKVTAAEISESFAQIGPLAAQSGIELNEIAAALAVMTANGTPAAEAFTQMRSALVALQKPTGELETLQKKLGVDFLKIAQDKGLAFAYNEIQKAADDAGIEMVTLTGRVEGSLFAAQVAGPNFAKYSTELQKVGKSAGTAAGQMAERQQGLNFQLQKLSANLKDAGISIGSALLPKLTPLVEKFNDFLAAHPEQIAAIGTNIADGFTKLADAAGKVDWDSIGGGLEITGRAAKTLVDAFLSLPPDMQKLVVAAVAINKVGGGIVTSGIKDIAGLLLSKLTTVNAANVTVIGKNVIGGGGAGGTPTGGGIGALGKLFLVGEAIGLVLAVKSVRDEIADGISVKAATIHQTATEFSKTAGTDALKGGLAAVDTALEKLGQDPIGTALLAGDAVRELEAIHTELTSGIQVRTGAVVSPDRADALKPLIGSVDAVYDILEQNRNSPTPMPLAGIDRDNIRSVETAIAAARAATLDGNALLRTIRDKSTQANVTVNVPISLQTQILGQTVTTTYSRYTTSTIVSGTGGSQI